MPGSGPQKQVCVCSVGEGGLEGGCVRGVEGERRASGKLGVQDSAIRLDPDGGRRNLPGRSDNDLSGVESRCVVIL